MYQEIIKPISQNQAKDYIAKNHPTGRGANGSQPICFGLYSGLDIVGVNTFGYNLSGGKSATTLFGDPQSFYYEYLDNLRFFTQQNHKGRKIQTTPSRFLSFCCKQIFRFRPRCKYIIAYGDGLHGFTGTIYQAANFLYIGKNPVSIWYIPNYGLVSQRNLRVNRKQSYDEIRKVHPDVKRVSAFNYRYLIFRDKETQDEKMKQARFKILPNSEVPKKEELKVIANDGTEYSPQFFKDKPFMPYYWSFKSYET